MNVILVGCEFSGKTTLADRIVKWSERNLGGSSHFHDHFTIPSTELTGQAASEYEDAHPQVKEMFQRFMITYHISSAFYSHTDHNLMGLHIEEAVYAPLYYGYGGENSGAPTRSPKGQRTEMARRIEGEILEKAPETVLILMKASPDVIKGRMKANIYPNPEIIRSQYLSKPFGEPTRGVVQEADVEFVLKRFEEEFEASLLKKKIVVDTTSATLDETLEEFVTKIRPHLSKFDQQRMQNIQTT